MAGHAASREPATAAVPRRASTARRQAKPAIVAAVPVEPETFATGAWPIALLRTGQCRFACTPHGARPEQHRFCGAPTASRAGKPTSWCAAHLARIFDASSRAPDAAAPLADPEPEPAGASTREA